MTFGACQPPAVQGSGRGKAPTHPRPELIMESESLPVGSDDVDVLAWRVVQLAGLHSAGRARARMAMMTVLAAFRLDKPDSAREALGWILQQSDSGAKHAASRAREDLVCELTRLVGDEFSGEESDRAPSLRAVAALGVMALAAFDRGLVEMAQDRLCMARLLPIAKALGSSGELVRELVHTFCAQRPGDVPTRIVAGMMDAIERLCAEHDVDAGIAVDGLTPRQRVVVTKLGSGGYVSEVSLDDALERSGHARKARSVLAELRAKGWKIDAGGGGLGYRLTKVSGT